MTGLTVPPSSADGGWLLISVSTTGAATSLRMQVWRKLKSLGGLYLQASVCLLPDRAPVAREVSRLVDRVHRDGGTARVLRMVLSDPAQDEALRAEANAARNGEYAEMLERIPAFMAELAQERAKGRATYAEVEESEADLTRFRTWLAKIEARDYFAAPGRQAARDAVEDCAAQLAGFEAEALANEAPAVVPLATHPTGLPSTGSDPTTQRPGAAR